MKRLARIVAVGAFAAAAVLVPVSAASANGWVNDGFEPDLAACDYHGQDNVNSGAYSDYYCSPNGDGSYTLYLYWT